MLNLRTLFLASTRPDTKGRGWNLQGPQLQLKPLQPHERNNRQTKQADLQHQATHQPLTERAVLSDSQGVAVAARHRHNAHLGSRALAWQREL
eukprot:1158281-Pelagomonas_calceolata.AAC.6